MTPKGVMVVKGLKYVCRFTWIMQQISKLSKFTIKGVEVEAVCASVPMLSLTVLFVLLNNLQINIHLIRT